MMADSNAQTTMNVLVVEDDSVDAEGIRRSLRKSNSNHLVEFAANGVEALNRLKGTPGNSPLQRPFVILLDLNMPLMDGHTFLNFLRDDPAISDSIVIVLTTSSSDRDRQMAYARNVAAYILKSDVGANHSNVIRLLDCYDEFVQMPMPIPGIDLH
jgi:CheY-like chemotaxis protein